MIKNSATRTALLALVLMVFFSAAAYAEQLSTFRLRIEDTGTGIGRVITDNVKLGVPNTNGDQDSPSFFSQTPVAGTIYFNGFVGNANVQIMAISGNLTDGFGGGFLSLAARVTCTSSCAPSTQIKITLEDSGYVVPAPTSTFVGGLGGYDFNTHTSTPEGHLTGLATSATFQTWLNIANDVPTFGNNGGPATFPLNPAVLTIPIAGSVAAYGSTGDQVIPPTFSGTGAGAPVTFSGSNYSIFSQATINFAGTGVADFTLTGSDLSPVGNGTSVPEPASLLLLGTGLVGMGLLRRKKGPASFVLHQ